VVEHPNFTMGEFRPCFRTIEGVLFCVIANPLRWDARPFVTLPAALKRSNFDDCDALLHGIS
jgi:hypothetical protein